MLWLNRHLQCAKGRDSRPSRRHWTARKRWGKRHESTHPVQVNLCGHVLFSTHLLYIPRSSRRSSGSLFHPDTRRHKRPQSPASTWSCLERWRYVEVSHPGQNSSDKEAQQTQLILEFKLTFLSISTVKMHTVKSPMRLTWKCNVFISLLDTILLSCCLQFEIDLLIVHIRTVTSHNFSTDSFSEQRSNVPLVSSMNQPSKSWILHFPRCNRLS